ncbi:hypothetical protein [Ectopseudomonas oleovorans]|uniref:hypothetical protein n=1 Tax=Ectopseudomonas oleovorans TaxID=301 RepID=UPI001FC93CE3|nr:hypothetical protein [Pseudomonas indoloxydans]
MIDSLMLSAARITTLATGQVLTNASGFFFRRDQRLFLVTSRHVMLDEPSGHQPADRVAYRRRQPGQHRQLFHPAV